MVRIEGHVTGFSLIYRGSILKATQVKNIASFKRLAYTSQLLIIWLEDLRLERRLRHRQGRYLAMESSPKGVASIYSATLADLETAK
jgi:ABC-type dipeptide/oligopeptide/nickel transport system ATPase component